MVLKQRNWIGCVLGFAVTANRAANVLPWQPEEAIGRRPVDGQDIIKPAVVAVDWI